MTRIRHFSLLFKWNAVYKIFTAKTLLRRNRCLWVRIAPELPPTELRWFGDKTPITNGLASQDGLYPVLMSLLKLGSIATKDRGVNGTKKSGDELVSEAELGREPVPEMSFRRKD